MSLGRHPNISGNLSLTIPGAGSGGQKFRDVHEYADYGGRFTPMGEPPLVGGDGTDEGDLWSLVTLDSPGMPVDIAFFYHSHSHSNGPFGYRRTCSLHLSARGAGTPIASGDYAGHLPIVTLTRGDDSTTTYKYNAGTGKFVCQSPELLNSLTIVVGTPDDLWVESTPDGRKMAYKATKDGSISPILSAKDAVGNEHKFQYLSGALLHSLEDAVGRRVTLNYDSGLLRTLQDWAGRVTTFTYDTETQCSNPRLTGVKDAAGNYTFYDYDNFGRVTSVEDTEGYVTTYAYDPSGKVTGRTIKELDGEYAFTAYNYSAFESSESSPPVSYARIEVSDPLEASFTHTLNEDFRLVEWQGPLNHTLTYAYNARGQEERHIDQYGGIWTTLYDSKGLPHQTYDAKNRLTQIEHDDFANPTYITLPDRGTQQMIWGYPGSSWDETGERRRLQASVDEVGNRTSYTYTPLGQVWEKMDAVGHITTNSYDAVGNLDGTLDWLENETSYDHDLAGNVNWMEDAAGNVTTYTYDRGDRLQTTLNPLNQLSTNLYDGLGNLISSIDFRGNETIHDYNIFGAVKYSEDPTGRYTAAGYDPVGQNITSVDGLGNITTTTYDAARRPWESIDPMLRIDTTVYDQTTSVIGGVPRPAHETINEWGNVSTTVYDAIGRVVGNIDPLGHITATIYDIVSGTHTYMVTQDDMLHRFTTTYDAAGRAIGTEDYLGSVTTTVYDALNRIRESIDPLGHITTTLYDQFDSEDRLATETVNALGQTTTTVYDELYRPIIQTDVAGNFTQTEYDALGRVLAVADPSVNWTTNLYDRGDQVHPAQATKDARGYVSTSIYDAAGRLVMSVDEQGAITTTVYDLAGRSRNTIDPLGHKSTTVYDNASRVIMSIDPNGNATTTIYDQRSTVAPYVGYPAMGQQDERGFITTEIYDAAGRAVATQNPDGTLWHTQYDSIDRPEVYLDPSLKATTLIYDVWEDGHPAVAMMDALGQMSTTVHDLRGQRIASIDVLGNSTLNQYDPLGRATAMRDARSNWTGFEYDDLQQTQVVVDANNGRTTSVFENRGLLSATFDPLNVPERYDYDATYNLTSRLDRNGQETSYTPDPLGRTHLIEYETGKKVTLLYDPAYRQTHMQDWTGDTSYNYDPADQLVGVNNSSGKDLAYTPDPAGNRHLLQDPQGKFTTYSYDSLGRISTIQNPFGDTTLHTYDVNGRLSTRLFGNGVLETRTYDVIGRSHTLKMAKGATLLSFYTTTYDKVTDPVSGLLRWQQQVAELDGSVTTYLYDVDDQLVDAARTGSNAYRTTYAYDALGNRLRQDVTINSVHSYTTYAYDKANQLLSSTQDGALASYSYDANGNLRLVEDSSGRTTYLWDEENRLQSIQYPGSNPTTHLYTADGLRQARTSDAGTTGYVWDELNVLEETDGSGAVKNQYIDYPGYWGGLVSSTKPDGKIVRRPQFNAARFNTSRFNESKLVAEANYLGFDPSGNTRQLVNDSGTANATITYLPFGEQVGMVNTSTYASMGGQFGYQQDDERLRYVRNRYLDVVTGRWLSRDPLEFGGGDINFYRNVGNDPINSSDPSGLADFIYDEEIRDKRAAWVGLQYQQQYQKERWERNEKALQQLEARFTQQSKQTGISKANIKSNYYAQVRADRRWGGQGDYGIQAPPGFLESLIPIWGSGKQAIHDFQSGNYVGGIVNTGFAVTDVFLIKSIATAGIRGAGKLSATIAEEGGMRAAAKKTTTKVVQSGLNRLADAKEAARILNRRLRKSPKFYKIIDDVMALPDGSKLEPFTVKQLGEAIASDPIARKAYNQILDAGYQVILYIGDEVGVAGQAVRPNATGKVLGKPHDVNVVYIYVNYNKDLKEGVATVIHESRHVRTFQRARRYESTQTEEFYAFCREEIYKKRRRLTAAERKEIWKKVERLYPELERGGTRTPATTIRRGQKLIR